MDTRSLPSVFLQFKYWFSFTHNCSCLISLKTTLTKAPYARVVDIELLLLIDQHTPLAPSSQDHNPQDMSSVEWNFTCKKMLISQLDSSYFLFEMVLYAGGYWIL